MSRLLNAQNLAESELHTSKRPSVNAAIGWLLAGLVLLASSFALGVAVAGDVVLPGEIEIMRAVQAPSWAGLDAFAWVASRVGDVWPGLILISLAAAGLCLARGLPDLAALFVVVAGLRAMNSPMKLIFASPRPPMDFVRAGEIATGYGYPSGHAFGAALVFGMIAIIAPRFIPSQQVARVVQVAAIIIGLAIAVSRVRLGVHWPSDVAGGVGTGLGLVCFLVAALAAWELCRFRT